MQREPSEIEINLLIFLTIELEKRIDLLSILNLNENDTVACGENNGQRISIRAIRSAEERNALCMA